MSLMKLSVSVLSSSAVQPPLSLHKEAMATLREVFPDVPDSQLNFALDMNGK